MRLVVRVEEARNLPPTDPNGLSDPYVRLQLGRQRYKSRVVKKSLSPTWGEDFSFKVEDLEEELVLSVLDEDRYFNDDFVGQVRIPVSRVFDSPDKSLPISWYPLLPKSTSKRSSSSKPKDPPPSPSSGEILLGIAFSQQGGADRKSDFDSSSLPLFKRGGGGVEGVSPDSPSRTSTSSEDLKDDKRGLAGRLAQMFNKGCDTRNNNVDPPLDHLPETTLPDPADQAPHADHSSSASFDDLIEAMLARDVAGDVPPNLPGGILVDQFYLTSTQDLNSVLFSPDSAFPRSLADFQGNTEQQAGPWMLENGGDTLKRVMTYVKAPTRLIKAVKATEEQTYVKADGKAFAVLASVSTPDVMYGSTFKVELLYCITPGPELPSAEPTSHLVISWRMNFLQSTMMKGMIENGARQGLKDSFDQFSSLLSQTIKPVDPQDMSSSKEQALASLQAEPQSVWKLAVQYLANFTVVSTIFMGIYVLVHICLCGPSSLQGLEFVGLDLPDSIGEVVVCGILVLQCERVLQLLSRFMHARMHRGSDHGIKAQGDGWLLTVALIEGSNLAAVDASGFCDPYVVFSCNGKTRNSSIKFQKSDPLWNEIFEFDAMDEPPSVLDVEVYDFDGPFDEATSLGHTEINFVKSNLSDLADVWVPLHGKLAQACHSKLHLRIFLNNTRGSHVVKEYLSRMEKEVGKKINLRSPQTNSAFQKLFGLSSEEFLINDFTCHLKRKMPLQGRLFLSARVIGFHANLFGHKTKFFFLWEDIEDIEILPPALSSMGSPIIVITLRPGKGMDAKNGAKTQDEEGRLKFHFHSFVSFSVAHRTIMALWKARSLTPEQKVQIVEEESETKILETEESGSFLGLDDVNMSEAYSATVSVPTSFLMEMFGGELDRKIMEMTGCMTYSYTNWESEKADVYERQLYYRLDKRLSGYRGEVTSTQQKIPLPDRKGWLVEEVMNLHGVPLGDYFNLHVRFQIEDVPSRPNACQVSVSFGIAWLKSTRHQKRITKNINSNLHDRVKLIFSIMEKEYANR